MYGYAHGIRMRIQQVLPLHVAIVAVSVFVAAVEIRENDVINL